MTAFKYILIISLILSFSCNKQSQKKAIENEKKLSFVDLTNIENTGYFSFDTLIDSCEYIPISNEVTIGIINNFIYASDSLFYITDTKYTKRICKINNYGTILKSHPYFGKGSKQGANLVDISYNLENNELLTLFHSPNKILVFDNNFNLLKSKTFNSNEYYRLCRNSNRIYLYSHDNSKLCTLNKLNENENLFLNFNFKNYPFSSTDVFFKTNNKLYFNLPKHPIIYLLNNNKLQPVLKIYKTNLFKDVNTSSQAISEFRKYPPTIKNIFDTDNYLLIFYSYKFRVLVSVISKKNFTLLRNGMVMDKTNLLGNLFFSKKDNVVYGIINADSFMKFYTKYQETYNHSYKAIFKKDPKQIKYDDNPVIVKYYFKKTLNENK